MAQAIASLSINPHPFGVDNTQRRQSLYGICALSAAGTYALNGIPLPWNALSDGVGRFIPQSTATQPFTVFFFSLLGNGSATAGGAYGYVFDQVHNTLRISNSGAELAAGAVILPDTIGFKAEYVRGV